MPVKKTTISTLASSAGTIVPFLGNEKSEEMLTEIACAINAKSSVQAVNITEVPNQTFLEAINNDTPKVLSIKRRLKRLAEVREQEIVLSLWLLTRFLTLLLCLAGKLIVIGL